MYYYLQKLEVYQKIIRKEKGGKGGDTLSVEEGYKKKRDDGEEKEQENIVSIEKLFLLEVTREERMVFGRVLLLIVSCPILLYLLVPA